MLEILNIRDADKIVPTDDDQQPTDPITENMNIINGKPVEALYKITKRIYRRTSLWQKINRIGDYVEESKRKEGNGRLAAHRSEHLAFQYRAQIEQELGFELPPPSEPLPEDIEFRISRLAGQAAEQLRV